MKYKNPVISGFYPDPSVCYANGKFYLVTSSFQYFPGVPLFESTDLVNWTQIGHVLTKQSQVMLDKVRSSGGVFAPTIRYDEGRFYMVTNNNSTFKNFYVYTDDIYGEWSDPIEVDQDGIDPSLLFDEGHCYFVSNGTETTVDGRTVNGVFQCEIDPATGKALSEKELLWCGSGGRYIESPHVYKIGAYYYLMVAEGGTEYGHMVTYARSENVWGPYESYEGNPVLTNRNKAPYIIQGIGHGDLIQKENGEWFMVSLGFRQVGEWEPFHNLGREVYLTPVHFNAAGWFTCGNDGTTDETYEIPGDFSQQTKLTYTFENTDWNIDWAYLRKMRPENYELVSDRAILTGSEITLEDVDSPTFIALRQKEFCMELSCDVKLLNNPEQSDTQSAGSSVCHTPEEAGITLYMCENEHYDIKLTRFNKEIFVALKLCIGGIKHTETMFPVSHTPTAGALLQAEGLPCKLIVRANNSEYKFYIQTTDDAGNSAETYLGRGFTKYLSSEVSSGFTGTMIGLFAIGSCRAEFTNFNCKYTIND